jgi:hypothetical protein
MTPRKAAPRKIVAMVIGICSGAVILPAAGSANSLGEVEGLPFWGHPYPYAYVYHRPPIECYDIRTVDTPRGPMIQETWICGSPVTAKY